MLYYLNKASDYKVGNNMIPSNNDRIIRRVKGLLKLAENNSNTEEAQSAFTQAQEMMVKYGVDPSELDLTNQTKDILTKAATEYKRLWWWERILASIIADNFRCSWYYSSKRFAGTVQMKRKIIFVGFETDVRLATEMYALARSALLHYTKAYMNNMKSHSRGIPNKQIKDAYIRGFIDGLAVKFEEQIKEQQWGLVIVVPEEVIQKTKEITQGAKTISFSLPSPTSKSHYDQGYKAGAAIDYTKRTIDD